MRHFLCRLVAALAALVVVAFSALTAAASHVPQLQGPVTDLTGALEEDRGRIEQVIAEVDREAGVQLWVLFVPTTGELSPADYSADVAAENGLGVDDALLLVALEDRTDQIWLSDGLDEISDAELDQIIGEVLEPRLAAGDYGDAVIATARALGQAAAGVPVPGGDGGEPVASGGLSLGTILAIGAVLVGVWILFGWFRSRRAAGAAAAEQTRQLADRAREANRLLVAADEGVRDMSQEVGFAEAQFDAAELEPTRSALAAAKEDLAAAFAVRQRLDDGTPEDPPTRRQLLDEIVTRASRALDSLTAERERLARLRDVERRAPEILAELGPRLDRLRARSTETRTRLESLDAVAGGSLVPVAGNVSESDKRIADARRSLEAGQAALAGDDRGASGRSARRADAAASEAEALLNAVDELTRTIEDVRTRIDAARHEAETSIAAARAASPSGADDRLAEAERLVESARSSLDGPDPDPVAAFESLVRANALADELAAAARAEAERRAREVTGARSAVDAAAARVAQAEAFVGSRHRGIGRVPRTRLAAARQALDQAQALVDSDPRAAAELARRASAAAEEAYRAAAGEFDAFDTHGRRPVEMTDALGAALPYLIPILLGGRGGWGGTPWGGGSRGVGGGGFSLPGPRRSGGGAGAGRSLGGSFGGGGRSRGGRW